MSLVGLMEKILILGIDAMDPKVCDKLMDEGKLPNLSELNYSRLQTTIPPETPVAWSGISSGCNPGKYGIFDFISRDAKTYLPLLNLSRETPGFMKAKYTCAMRGKPVWRILTEKNIHSTVIRWPVTFPPERIHGRMLSGLGVVDIKGMLGKYSFYTDESKPDGNETGSIIPVSFNQRVSETYVSGPMKNLGGKLTDVKAPMRIHLQEDRIELEIGGKKHIVEKNSWSKGMKAEFKIGMLTKVSGIFRAYLISTKPDFRMYVSSIQIDPEKPFLSISYPENYAKELVDVAGLYYTLGMPEETKAITENKVGERVLFEQIRDIEEERTKMFFYELKRFREGLYAFVFDAGDRLKHVYWKNNVLDGKKKFEIAHEIEDYYVKKDNLLGKVLSDVKENTRIFVLSDHGFNSFQRNVNVNNWLEEQGYLKKKEGEDNTSLLRFVDWRKSKAYALGFTSVYINQSGREGQGIVEQGDKESLIDEMVKKMKTLKDDKYNKRVFTNIYKGSEVYSGEYAADAPDIVIGFAEGFRMSWKSGIGQLDDEMIFDNEKKWKGDHLIDRSHVPGVLFTNFKIKEKNPDAIDIAPTVLNLLDVEIPEHMDGKSLI